MQLLINGNKGALFVLIPGDGGGSGGRRWGCSHRTNRAAGTWGGEGSIHGSGGWIVPLLFTILNFQTLCNYQMWHPTEAIDSPWTALSNFKQLQRLGGGVDIRTMLSNVGPFSPTHPDNTSLFCNNWPVDLYRLVDGLHKLLLHIYACIYVYCGLRWSLGLHNYSQLGVHYGIMLRVVLYNYTDNLCNYY